MDIVIFVVACMTNLLYCHQIPTDHLTFENLIVCNEEKSHIIKHYIVDAERHGYPVVMAKCQIILKEKTDD